VDASCVPRRGLVVSLPDILLAGGGAFLATRHGRSRGIGIVVLFCYFVAVIGSFLGDSPPRLDPDDLQSVGTTFGVIAAVTGWLLGRRLRRRTEQLGPSLP
jgi:hypothetical protein